MNMEDGWKLRDAIDGHLRAELADEDIVPWIQEQVHGIDAMWVINIPTPYDLGRIVIHSAQEWAERSDEITQRLKNAQQPAGSGK